MTEAVFEYFIHNGNVLKVSEFEKDYKDIYPSVYEVIRVVDCIPVFLEEHYERLLNSSKIVGFKIDISFEELKENIIKMVHLNNIKNYNIKIVINNLSKPEKDIYYFFIKSSYPDITDYQKGVKTLLYNAERQNPNAKVINMAMRNEINKLLDERKCFEALLVNNKDEITEGSRSNTFFIKNNEVFTAPPSDVLLGITRQRIIMLCRRNNIKVSEVPIRISELSTYEAAFISGTSPKVLPINVIENLPLCVNNPLLQRVMNIYDDEIQRYLKSN